MTRPAAAAAAAAAFTLLALLLACAQEAQAKPKSAPKPKPQAPPEVTERLDIDPALQGIWVVHATSDDGGKTVKHVRPPATFCRVGALRITFSSGSILEAVKVAITKDKGGRPANVIFFATGGFWFVTQMTTEAPYMYLAQSFSPGAVEQMRIVVSVSK